MGYKFNPFTGNFDTTDSPNGVFDSVEVNGDINLDDGGTYATTLQLITPTANRTISFPDATGTVALVAGSSGQLVYNNAGAYAGAPSTSVGATGNITLSLAGAASTPPVSLTGTWFSGGTSTTTKPQLLIEPTGTTSTAWSTSGTGLGVNAPSGFLGNLLDLQLNGSSKLCVTSAGLVGIGTSAPSHSLHVNSGTSNNVATFESTDAGAIINITDSVGNSSIETNDTQLKIGVDPDNNVAGSDLRLQVDGSTKLLINDSGNVGIGTTTPGSFNASFNNLVVGSGSGNEGITVYTGNVDSGFLAFNDIADTSVRGLIEYSHSGDFMGFRANGSERARIDSSGRLLVGTSSTRSIGTLDHGLQIESAGSPVGRSRASFCHNEASATGPGISFAKSRGTTVGSNTIVQSEDFLGYIAFCGADGSDSNSFGASIECRVDGTPGANDMPGRLVFSTTADGASGPTERLRITSAGVLQIADAGNIAVGTTTGTKIGTATTQKLGFFNNTPVAQPTAVADATDAASVITQLNALLARMRDLGLIAT